MKEEIFQRKQFTFYESFYQCIEKTLKKKSEKLAAYEALIHYALYGAVPEKSNIPDSVLGLMEAFYPILNTARQKAKSGKEGGSAKQSGSKIKNKNKIENKIEHENKTEIKDQGNNAEFERFWCAYPRKVGKEEAYKAFADVSEQTDVLIDAVHNQIGCELWQREGGRYVPNPATWLRNKRWTDSPEVDLTPPLSDLDRRAIERMMKEGFS